MGSEMCIRDRPESYGWSVIQTLFSRSDRRLAPVIALVRERKNSLGSWKNAYKNIEAGEQINGTQDFSNLPKLPPWEEVLYAKWATSDVLPWSHLNGPVSSNMLIQHHHESLNQSDDQTQEK